MGTNRKTRSAYEQAKKTLKSRELLHKKRQTKKKGDFCFVFLFCFKNKLLPDRNRGLFLFSHTRLETNISGNKGKEALFKNKNNQSIMSPFYLMSVEIYSPPFHNHETFSSAKEILHWHNRKQKHQKQQIQGIIATLKIKKVAANTLKTNPKQLSAIQS